MQRKHAIRAKGLKAHLDAIMENGYDEFCKLYELKASDSLIGRKFKRSHTAVAFWREVYREEQGK